MYKMSVSWRKLMWHNSLSFGFYFGISILTYCTLVGYGHVSVDPVNELKKNEHVNGLKW